MPSGSRFDPRAHARRLESGADYLDVKWRIAWLRSEHPDAQIETELLVMDEDRALCKASVRLPTGGAATAHASASRGGGAGQVELAETRAIGRALAGLGYGAEYAEEDVVPGRGAERPVSLVPQPSSVRPIREPEPVQLEPVPDALPAPRTDRTDRAPVAESSDEPRPIALADQELPVAPPSETSDASAEQEATIVAEAPAAPGVDVSWTRFWEWAKDRGYRDRAHLQELLGIDVMSMSPRDVRKLIIKYELDNPPSGRVE